MIEQKYQEIRDFLTSNADPSIMTKYAKYFKDGYDGYGIDQKVFETQRDVWLKDWGPEMNLEAYLDLGDMLISSGKFEESAYAIHFLAAFKNEFSQNTFNRISYWFKLGICNWATTDVLCMLLLSSFLDKKVIELQDFKSWLTASSQWQRRAVPVTFVQQIKAGMEPDTILPVVEPLMKDESEYVQKGLGTLLRELWKKYPDQIEEFLFKWKDACGRKIIQYATEKMTKEKRSLFKKQK
jgi:3-methyladenine DNA glycosylase AlkD